MDASKGCDRVGGIVIQPYDSGLKAIGLTRCSISSEDSREANRLTVQVMYKDQQKGFFFGLCEEIKLLIFERRKNAEYFKAFRGFSRLGPE